LSGAAGGKGERATLKKEKRDHSVPVHEIRSREGGNEQPKPRSVREEVPRNPKPTEKKAYPPSGGQHKLEAVGVQH